MLNIVKILVLSFLLFVGGVEFAQAAVATDCTLYAAANGKDTNSGTSPTAPKTLNGASSAAQPGAVICLLGGTYNLSGTFYPARAGTASAWIVYKNYGDSDVNMVWTGGSSATDLAMWHLYGGSLWNGKNYIEVRGINFDGQNAALRALECQNSHHNRFINNKVKNTGASGIKFGQCDYGYVDGNQVTHVGYTVGWGSGINFNSNHWYDSTAGFHSYVLNNIVSGTYDSSTNHSDGNGIIMDLSNGTYDYTSADTPPVLIANNVIYENGGRCWESFTSTNHWWINNTCYKNALDTSNTFAEADVNKAKNISFINNLVYAIDSNHYAYAQFGTNENITYRNNLHFNSKGLNFTAPSGSNFIKADPLFLSPPATSLGGYSTAQDPALLRNELALQSTSPAIDAGIDPTTITPIVRKSDGTLVTDTEIISGLRQYLVRDINGNPRPQGNGFDLGAYEYTPSSDTTPPATPSGLQVQIQ